MNKARLLVLLGISLTLAVIGFFTFSDDGPISTTHSQDTVEEQIEPVGQERAPFEKVQPEPRSQITHSTNDVESCLKQLELYDDFLIVHKKLEALGMSGTQLAGIDGYQQVPLESLRSYAEANDLDAMYLYGVELLWKSGLGFYQNDNYRDPSLSSEQFGEQVRNHEFDREQFQRGKDYLYKAAVKGKLIGLLEIGLMHKTVGKKLAETDMSQPELIEFLGEGYAYLEIAKDVYKTEPLLIKEAGLERYTLESFIKTGVTEAEMDNVMPLVAKSTEKHFKRLKSNWVSDRNYQGLAVYPEVFTDEEEALYEKAQSSECF